MYYAWRPYVPVAKRRQNAEREMARLRKKGHAPSPVVIDGRTIARTFWGKAWCDNLERYSDFANRLPRGRTYVRNGSVVDLQVAAGDVKATVSGSRLYQVRVKVAAVPAPRWTSMCEQCAGAIDSLVELLQGRFSKGVMERICQPGTGLFPMPTEIEFSCSCPDWASMCKHVAAVLYGIGARLDDKPELLFTLRQVEAEALIAKAGNELPLAKVGPAADRVLVDDGLAELFGLDLEGAAGLAAASPDGAGALLGGKATGEAPAPVNVGAGGRGPKRAARAASPAPQAAKAPATTTELEPRPAAKQRATRETRPPATTGELEPRPAAKQRATRATRSPTTTGELGPRLAARKRATRATSAPGTTTTELRPRLAARKRATRATSAPGTTTTELEPRPAARKRPSLKPRPPTTTPARSGAKAGRARG